MTSNSESKSYAIIKQPKLMYTQNHTQYYISMSLNSIIDLFIHLLGTPSCNIFVSNGD